MFQAAVTQVVDDHLNKQGMISHVHLNLAYFDST